MHSAEPGDTRPAFTTKRPRQISAFPRTAPRPVLPCDRCRRSLASSQILRSKGSPRAHSKITKRTHITHCLQQKPLQTDPSQTHPRSYAPNGQTRSIVLLNIQLKSSAFRNFISSRTTVN